LVYLVALAQPRALNGLSSLARRGSFAENNAHFGALAGARQALPIALGVFTYGLVFGLLARQALLQAGEQGEDQVQRLETGRIAAAARLVRRGAVFPLGAPLDIVSPAMFSRGTPRHTTIRTGNGRGLDDVIDNVYPQASSQWDSLGHISFDFKRYYNGRTVEDVIDGGHNTIDHWARRGIAGRAVLLDLERTCAFEQGTAHAFSVAALEPSLITI